MVLPPGFLRVVLGAVLTSVLVKGCPSPLDCALQRRQFCTPGSSHCGPCLAPLVEDTRGLCMDKVERAPSDKHTPLTSVPELDEEIDVLSSILAKQQQLGKGELTPEEKLRTSQISNRKKSPPNSTTEPTSHPIATPHLEPATRGTGPLVSPYPSQDTLLIILSSLCIIVATAALVLVAVCLIWAQRGSQLAQKVDYPAYRIMGSNHSDRTLPGDKNLAQSAQMYHYQHQKQQILSMEKHKDEPRTADSGTTSDEENEDGDFTVYECPGLAPTGEMEVKNPLFDDYSVNPQQNHK